MKTSSDKILLNRAANKTHINNNGKYVLYWMQSAQRIEYNHALYYSIKTANSLKLPLIIIFFIDKNYPESNETLTDYIINGILSLKPELDKIGASFYFLDKDEKLFYKISKESAVIISENSWLKYEKDWKSQYSNISKLPISLIETNSVIPYYIASDKEEYNAATLRRKISKLLPEYLTEFSIPKLVLKKEQAPQNIFNIFSQNSLNFEKTTIDKFNNFPPGYNSAKIILTDFIYSKLEYYAEKRNEPSENWFSNMSPYLHFGQISPLEITLMTMRDQPDYAKKYLDELIVRRELSINFVNYNSNYDKYDALPKWARESLENNRIFERPYIYTYKQFENAETHDPFWNAAQKEMLITGKMHAYMRMYWGKKILEWSKSPEEAYYTAIKLNNTYSIDGRDPNSYAGVAWCFGKHDRAWFERKIFGKVRYMNENGLKRKFNIEKYVNQINEIENN